MASVTEFVLYFSLSKQYPDKHKSSPPTNTALRCIAGHVSLASSHTSSLHAAVCCVQKLIQLREGRKEGQHLAVHNYIIHLLGFNARSGSEQRVKKVIKNHWTGWYKWRVIYFDITEDDITELCPGPAYKFSFCFHRNTQFLKFCLQRNKKFSDDFYHPT